MMTMSVSTPSTAKLTTGAAALGILAGVGLLVIVAATSALSLMSGHLPPSTPWAQLALTTLGGMLIAIGLRAPSKVTLLVSVGALLSSALWMTSAILNLGR